MAIELAVDRRQALSDFGLSDSYTIADLKTAYRDATKRWHPDLAKDINERETRNAIMLRLNNEYDYLLSSRDMMTDADDYDRDDIEPDPMPDSTSPEHWYDASVRDFCGEQNQDSDTAVTTMAYGGSPMGTDAYDGIYDDVTTDYDDNATYETADDSKRPSATREMVLDRCHKPWRMEWLHRTIIVTFVVLSCVCSYLANPLFFVFVIGLIDEIIARHVSNALRVIINFARWLMFNVLGGILKTAFDGLRFVAGIWRRKEHC